MNLPDHTTNGPAKAYPGSSAGNLAPLNDLIGQIYDCALAPEGWEQTLKIICERGNFHCASINLLDRKSKNNLIQQCSGVDIRWLEAYSANEEVYGAEIYHVRTALLEKLPADTPMALSHHVPRDVYINMRYYKEWMQPQGLIDIMQLIVMRQPDRMGAINFARHERVGPIGDEELALGAYLLPHLQRAITISNLLEVQSLRTVNLRAVIRNLSAGILLVAENGAILEANAAAEQLLNDGKIIRSADGRLAAARADLTRLLHKSILSAVQGISSSAGGITLGCPENGLINAHILPLASVTFRPHFHEAAVAAIFLSPDANQFAKLPGADIIGVIYGLTAAERRVVDALADGKTSLQAAQALGISEATMRSHLTRIFSKTGVTRQAELISLMYRLALPLHGALKPEEK
jgi:DNA-binding CsgD family transcriptional regulator/PAS domain-containing protein